MSELCGEGAVCKNTPGSFSCVCADGFRRNGSRCEGTSSYFLKEKLFLAYCGLLPFEDINECETMCKGRKQLCRNTLGSFVCGCSIGYGGQWCRDVDECRRACSVRGSRCGRGSHPLCPRRGSRCVNLDGDYACTIGARSNPASAPLRQSTCAFANHGCNKRHMRCLGTPGRFKCDCSAGWELIVVEGGGWCADVDECSEGLASCDLHARCLNTPGSYECQCRPGWKGDGKRGCQPVKKCPSSCHPQAKCRTSLIPALCRCNAGYRGDGVVRCEGERPGFGWL